MPGRTRIRSQTRAAQNRRRFQQQKAEPQYKPPEQIKGQKKGATPAQKKRWKETRAVKSGDSWFSIAQEEYGDQALTPEIMAANPEIKTLRAGQYIKLPKAPRPPDVTAPTGLFLNPPPPTEQAPGGLFLNPEPPISNVPEPLPTPATPVQDYLESVAAGERDVEVAYPLPDWLAWLQPAVQGYTNLANAGQRKLAEAILPTIQGGEDVVRYGQPARMGAAMRHGGLRQSVEAVAPMAKVASDINTAPQHAGRMRIKVLEMLIQNGQMPLYITPEEAEQLFGVAAADAEAQAAMMAEMGYSLQNGRYVRSSYLPPTPPSTAGEYSGSSYRRGYGGGYGGRGGGGGASGGRGRLVGGQQAQSERRYPGYFGVVNWKIS